MAGVAAGPMISIDWIPEPAVIAAGYVTFGVSFRSFKEPLKRSVEKVMAPSITKNFDVEGRPRWQSLTEETITTRSYGGFGAGPILDRTGELRDAATSTNIWVISSDKAEIPDLPGDVWYGKVHQGGGTFSVSAGGGPVNALRRIAGLRSQRASVGTGVIPKREFLQFQAEDVDKIEDVFMDWVRERAVMSGFRPGIG
jgi:phage gpG-like protein